MSTERDEHLNEPSSSTTYDDGEVMSAGEGEPSSSTNIPSSPGEKSHNIGNSDMNTNANSDGKSENTTPLQTDDDDAPSSQEDAAAETDTPTPTSGTTTPKKFSVSEVPRWRFVNEAKKTSGYSSVAAGKVVEGLSAEELAGTYNVPEWKITNESTTPVKETATAMDVDEAIGEKERRKVGKLNVQEEEGEVEETFEGTFGGFHKILGQEEEEEVPGEEEEEGNLSLIGKEEERIDELATLEGEILEAPLLIVAPEVKKVMQELAPLQVEQHQLTAEEEAVPLENDPPNEPKMAIVEATPTTDELDEVEKQTPVEEAASIPVVPIPLDEQQPVEEMEKPSEEEQPQSSNKRKWLLLLLLLLVVITAAILGIVLGGKKSNDKSNGGNKSIIDAVIISEETNETNVPTSNTPISNAPTSSPSTKGRPTMVPSPSPSSLVCSTDTKLFTVQHTTNYDGGGGVQQQQQQQEQFWRNFTSTWVVRDACTGEEIIKCLPCSNADPTPLSLTLLEDHATTSTTTTTTTTSISSTPTTYFTTFSTTPDPVCIGPTDRPRPVRNGERFRFNLLGSNGQCMDDTGLLYEWGQFNDVDNFGECAKKCIQDTPSSLILRSIFRGYDYDCHSNTCRCLYDESTLDSTNNDGFDRTSLDDDQENSDELGGGVGEIYGTLKRAGYYCGKLVGVNVDVSDYPTYSPSAEEDTVRQIWHEGDAGVDGYDVTGRSDGASGCLPDDKDYVFEVKPSDVAGACCGFDPDSFVVTYDDIVVGWGEPDTDNIFSNSDGSNTNESMEKLSYFGQRSEPCPSSNPSTMPSSVPSTVPPTRSPSSIPPIRDVVYSETNPVVPCREVIESEMAGRINGLPSAFCGFCLWKASRFNCYQRVSYLVTRYGMEQVAARQGLLDQGHCSVPSEITEELRAAMESIPYCNNVPSLEEQTLSIATTKTIVTNKPTSSSPSGKPTTKEPTSNPSNRPTTEEPTSSSPSNEPTDFPLSSEPSHSPSSASSPPSEQPSPEPVTDSPTMQPTKQPTKSPTQRPSTTSPSKRPTKQPTQRPSTPYPTSSPTDQPSCDADYQDFNLCFAIDMSGSVCNQGTTFLCEGCEPELICNDIGVDKDTCCANFFDVVEFAKLMVKTLQSIPSDQSYSVVGFATDAALASDITTSSIETLDALDGLTYSGGKTNHADAMAACQASLLSSSSSGGGGGEEDKKNLILFITDGDPTEPKGSPRVDAEEAAAEAKAEGVFIIPVMIVPQVATAGLNPETVTYLKEISSDGSIFEVSDFGVLGSLRESLLAQVSCQV